MRIERRRRRDTTPGGCNTRCTKRDRSRARFNVARSLLSRVPGEVGKNRSRTPTRLEAEHDEDDTILRYPLTKRDWPRLLRRERFFRKQDDLSESRAPDQVPFILGIFPEKRRARRKEIRHGKLHGEQITFPLSRLRNHYGFFIEFVYVFSEGTACIVLKRKRTFLVRNDAFSS